MLFFFRLLLAPFQDPVGFRFFLLYNQREHLWDSWTHCSKELLLYNLYSELLNNRFEKFVKIWYACFLVSVGIFLIKQQSYKESSRCNPVERRVPNMVTKVPACGDNSAWSRSLFIAAYECMTVWDWDRWGDLNTESERVCVCVLNSCRLKLLDCRVLDLKFMFQFNGDCKYLMGD